MPRPFAPHLAFNPALFNISRRMVFSVYWVRANALTQFPLRERDGVSSGVAGCFKGSLEMLVKGQHIFENGLCFI